MKTKFFAACAAVGLCLAFQNCKDLIDQASDCTDVLNTLCKENCDKTVHLDGAINWSYVAGADNFVITINFDKDIDAAASDFANGNSIVVYRRIDQDPATSDGEGVAGTISGSGKSWQFTSNIIGAAVITNPANFFEIAVENNGSDKIGVRTTDGGVFDADNDCSNLTSEHRAFHQF